MAKRGRKSVDALAIAPVSLDPRPKAPDHLNAREAEVWEAVASSCDPDYFRRSQHDLLANMCRHIITARDLSKWIEAIISGDKEGDISDVQRLTAMRAKETSAATSIARALRLTLQAQIRPVTAARRQRGSERPRPWDGGIKSK